MRRFTTTTLALTLAATGALTGAAVVAAQDGSDLKIGLVTDVGTINDRNFNQFSWEGAQAGAAAIGAGEPQYAISQASADIQPNIQAFIDQDYDIIVTVGFAAGMDVTGPAAASPASTEPTTVSSMGISSARSGCCSGGIPQGTRHSSAAPPQEPLTGCRGRP